MLSPQFTKPGGPYSNMFNCSLVNLYQLVMLLPAGFLFTKLLFFTLKVIRIKNLGECFKTADIPFLLKTCPFILVFNGGSCLEVSTVFA